MKRTLFLIIIVTTTSLGVALAQKMSISGKVTDAQTGDPVPLANIVVTGTTTGTNTDFSGRYQLDLEYTPDSITASYIGYDTRTKYVAIGSSQVIDFQLSEVVQNLDEMVFVAEENPAQEILRNVVKNKRINDKRSLEALSLIHITDPKTLQ